MMIAHKIIDSLRGSKKYRLLEWPGWQDLDRRATADRIDRAQKFDFGSLPLERNPGGVWDLPDLTADEMNFWRDGLIPLPFPLCWYEFVLGEFRSGVLVREEGSKWVIERIDFVENDVGYDGVTVSIDRAQTGSDLTIAAGGNIHFLNIMRGSETYMKKHVASVAPLVIYLTLMLNSRSTETRRESPPQALQRAQEKRGHTPLPGHLIVRIVPDKYQYERDPATGRQRRSPRLHWRRSHLRRYDHEVPSAKFIEGVWLTVIPRALVGKAELGEVSHEYRIDSAKERHESMVVQRHTH